VLLISLRSAPKQSAKQQQQNNAQITFLSQTEKQRLTGDPNSGQGTENFFCLLRKPKIHYRFQKKKLTWKYPDSGDSSLQNKVIFSIQFNTITPKTTNKNITLWQIIVEIEASCLAIDTGVTIMYLFTAAWNLHIEYSSRSQIYILYLQIQWNSLTLVGITRTSHAMRGSFLHYSTLLFSHFSYSHTYHLLINRFNHNWIKLLVKYQLNWPPSN